MGKSDMIHLSVIIAMAAQRLTKNATYIRYIQYYNALVL
jgi:hypothetical protein